MVFSFIISMPEACMQRPLKLVAHKHTFLNVDFLLPSKILVGINLQIILKKLHKCNWAQLSVAHYFNNREMVCELLSYFQNPQWNAILNIESLVKTKLFNTKIQQLKGALH